MVIESRHRDRLEFPTFLILFVICLIIEMIDFDPVVNQFKPALVSMLICFWVMHKSEVINLGIVWFMGLLVDLAMGSYLGEHAFGKYLIGWLMAQGASRIRLGTLIQQAFYVFVFILVEYLFYWLVGLIVGNDSLLVVPFIKASSSALFWPLLFTIFGGLWAMSNRLFR